MTRRPDVMLEWVTHEGDEVHVSDFAHLKPRDRPKVTCPICQEQVVMRLGTEKAHHAAHKPGVDCAVSDGETALHLNTKLHLARVMRGLSELEIALPCGHAGRPAYQHLPHGLVPVTAFTGWDEVAVELAVGSRRPDIVLLRHGVAVGAVEVHVSNAVSVDKAADLTALGLQWVEVAGSVALYTAPTAWSGGPLFAERFSGETRPLCPACVALVHEQERRALKLQLAQELRPRLLELLAQVQDAACENGELVRRLRIADVYYSSGKKWRETFAMVEVWENGQVIRHELRMRSGDTLHVERGAPTRESWLRLREAYRQRKRFYEDASGARFDSRMDWIPLDRLLSTGDGLGAYACECLAHDFAGMQVDHDRLPTAMEVYKSLEDQWFHQFPRTHKWSRRNKVWFPMREYRGYRWSTEDPGGHQRDREAPVQDGRYAVSAFLGRVLG